MRFSGSNTDFSELLQTAPYSELEIANRPEVKCSH